MGFRKLNPEYKDGAITSLEQIYRVKHRQDIQSNLDIDVYAAKSWLLYTGNNIPKSCSLKTRRELNKAIASGLALCHEIIIEELIERMREADRMPEYQDSCGTKALWGLYFNFCQKVGWQQITFLSFVEAATKASLKSVWNRSDTLQFVSLTGNVNTRVGHLLSYAQDLGFAVEGANDAEGNVALVIVDVKAKAKKHKGVI
jgi:hypothetical protein